MSKKVLGIAVSGGIAFGKAYVVEELDLSFETFASSEAETELARLQTALDQSETDLLRIQEKVRLEQGSDNALIFGAQILALHDPEVMKVVQGKIRSENRSAESAFYEATLFHIKSFEEMDDVYMAERAADLKDVTRRVLLHLLGLEEQKLQDLHEDSILIADDVTPSETAQMNMKFIKGFVTNKGGKTSHSAIMARTLEVPAVVGTQNGTSEIQHGDFLIMNGTTGEVHINPDKTMQNILYDQHKAYLAEKASWQALKDEPTLTKDEQVVELVANIGSPQDVNQVILHGAEGIGLYRTEFLYMESNTLPTEEEQFLAYRTVLEKLDDKPVIVRTFDIGGDKRLPYLSLPEEKNPFLGLRAVRFALRNTDIFRTQIRALLRASPFGNLKIMFPMIATLEELDQAKLIVQAEKLQLTKENIPFANQIDLGIMVEIPSTAIMARQFAKEVDFFSIGTNDLIQYTLAADRMNENVAYLYQPFHPAILQLVKTVIDAAHAEDKWVGMCGEMASDLTAIPLLLGLGLDEFSVNAPAILPVRNLIKKLDTNKMEQLANKSLTLRTAEEVELFVNQELKKLQIIL